MTDNPSHNQTLELRDGRRLGWAEFGDPQGKPVFYCHGWPGSRIEAGLLHAAARRCKVRLISADRPGLGLSDFQEGRSFADWPQDVAQLGDALRLGKFALLGVSGGAPYAAACAAGIPSRLTRVGIVSGMGPVDRPHSLDGMCWWNRLLISAARKLPRSLRFLYGLASLGIRRMPRAALFLLRRMLPEPDRSVLNRSEIRQFFPGHLKEIFRQGARGSSQDGELYLKPWNLRLEEAGVPVHLWHGDADVAVPASMGRFLSQQLSGCQSKFCAGEGHISLLIDHADEILGTLREGSSHAEAHRRRGDRAGGGRLEAGGQDEESDPPAPSRQPPA